MKNHLTILMALIAINGIGQGAQNFERRTAIEINERVDFFHVNDRYELESDTMFYSKSGFLIHPDFATDTVDGKLCVIVSYPNYRRGHQHSHTADEHHIDSVKNNSLTLTQVSKNGVHSPIAPRNSKARNGLSLAVEKTKFDALSKQTLYDTRFTKGCAGDCSGWRWVRKFVPEWRNYKITNGVLTVPFKLRPKQDTVNFSMTTDVTLGSYLGITKRFSRRNPVYVTVPITLGLSFINIQDNTTVTEQSNDQTNVVPGVSWSTGIIFQVNKIDIGVVLGQDYASGLGNDWIYHGKTWYSFAIGYSFLKAE